MTENLMTDANALAARPYAAQLCAIARASPPLMRALAAARGLGLASWCIGAGAVRNRVWDHLHGHAPSAATDVDLVFFDPDAPPDHDHALRTQLLASNPEWDWDVTNQAHVHLWYGQTFGTAVPPLGSLAEGVGSWPEYATCVGLTLTADHTLTVVAPHGLDDLFGLRVRHNPARATVEQFMARHTGKRWLEQWPRLRLSVVGA